MLHLLKKRSFGAMTLSQFLGAFNDNAFKQVIVLLAAALAAGSSPDWVRAHPWGGAAPAWLSPQAVPPFLFSLPFVVFGPFTGSLADRLSKSWIIKAANLMEVGVMVLATLAYIREDYGLLLTTVFMMGMQSALFGPSKYGCIKELVGQRELSRANALIQSSTMVAVLAGVFLGGIFLDTMEDQLWLVGLWYVSFALLGWLVSLFIERLPAVDPGRRLNWNPISEFVSHWRATHGERNLVLSIIGSSLYYLMAAAFLIVIPTYGEWLVDPETGEKILSQTGTSGLMAMSGLGIIAGAILAGRVSKERIEGGLVPLGLLVMAASLLAVALDPRDPYFVGLCLFGMGLGSGLFTIPIRCLIQSLPREGKRGAVQGLAEVMDFVGILLATPMFIIWDKALGLTPPQMFLLGGFMMLALALLSVYLVGEFLVRLILLGLTHTLYRLRIRGSEHIPEQGGALLVANHLSFIDGLLVAAAAQRPVRFLMFRDYFDTPLLGPLARRMGAIPVSSGDTEEEKDQALRAAADAVAAGELLCIFAEGAITRTATMLPFARGLERIARQGRVPIIPVGLDRLWGSIFSYEGGRFFWKLPHRIPYPVDVEIAAPMPFDSAAWQVRNRIQEAIARRRRQRDGRPGSLAWRLLVSARLNARAQAVLDSTGESLSYRQLLVKSLAMRAALHAALEPAPRRVGVVLPPGVRGTLVNTALCLQGRVSVNLNPTLPADQLEDMLRRADVGTIVSSRAYLESLSTSPSFAGCSLVFVEDLEASVGALARWRSTLLTFMPAWALARLATPHRSAAEEATVLFTSGSTGPPKGVVLSHGNLLSNVQSIQEVFYIGPRDSALCVLPLFHGFGYTVGLWACLLAGARAVCHADPADGEAIGRLGKAARVTLAFGTPAMLEGWMDAVPPAAFANLRVSIAGGERLLPALAGAFEERFGVRVFEGYGCTECAPVISFNVPGTSSYSRRQVAEQRGSAGRPLPGVAVRVLDPESRRPAVQDEVGLLQVKGPNVMQGYLTEAGGVQAALDDGWYTSDDLASIDWGGFIRVIGRASRVSRAPGQVVVHEELEQALRETLDELDPGSSRAVALAVTRTRDEDGQERLVVLHTGLPCAVEELRQALGWGGPTSLEQPGSEAFFEVETLPYLATGKLDLCEIERLAAALA